MFQDRRVAIKGCLFHFSQALYRKYIELNKKQKSQNLIRLFYLFIWLPFMKANEITDFITELETRDVTGCREYIDYFKKQWLPNLNWWIVDQRAPNCVQTNCGLESFHGQLNRALPQARPDILSLSETLLRLDNEKFLDIRRGLSGVGSQDVRKFAIWSSRNQIVYEQMEWFINKFPRRTNAQRTQYLSLPVPRNLEESDGPAVEISEEIIESICGSFKDDGQLAEIESALP